MKLCVCPPACRSTGFTLVELLVATAIFSIILTVSLSIFSRALSIWNSTSTDLQTFQSARLAYDLMGRNLAQATLNPYLDYLDSQDRFATDPGFSFPPARYGRRSDLQFVIGQTGESGLPGTSGTGASVFFQFPYGFGGESVSQAAKYAGMNNLLNVCGYYVEFSPDSYRPPFVQAPLRYRYRLMQLLPSTQVNTIHQQGGEGSFGWFTSASPSDAYPVAENIIALIVVPLDPHEADDFLTTDYTYDSRASERANPQPVTANQLPPMVRLTLVAIDETSAIRMQDGATEPAEIRSALEGKFQNVAQYQADLDSWESSLRNAGITYRVFSSTLSMKESKWTRD